MQEFVGVEIHQGGGNLAYAAYRFLLWESASLVHIVIESAVREILHRVVDGVVSLKDLQHLHDIRMRKHSQFGGFASEFVSILFDIRVLRDRYEFHSFTLHLLVHEEFL